MEKLIKRAKSVIPACDVTDLIKLEEIVTATYGVSGIGGYKVGFKLIIPEGLKKAVEAIMRYTNSPIIYDHQKGGTDIPGLGLDFAKVVKSSGADAAILYPFAGAATEREWIKACQKVGLVVLVGGHMTQKEFLEDEGGFIANTGPERIYTIAAENGVSDFVVPGNKVELVLKYRQLLERLLGKGNFTLYVTGFFSQGGDIEEIAKVAGENWHAIVGNAIYKAEGVENIRNTALEITSQIAGEKQLSLFKEVRDG